MSHNDYRAFMKRRRSAQNRNQAGQAISEYGMVIAFVAILCAMVFAFTPEKIGAGISMCFSEVTTNLQNINNEAMAASS